MQASVVIDIALLAIFAASIIISASRGAFKAISGILGTVLGFVGAYRFGHIATPALEKIIRPIARRAVQSAADSQGLESILDNSFTQELAEMFGRLVEALGLSAQAGQEIQQQAQSAGGTIVDAISDGIAAQIAPIIGFIAFFVVIKLAVSLVCRLLSIENLPIISTINKLGGALLGAVSGLVIVVALCWGVMAFASDEDVGIVNRPNLRQSTIGGIVANIIEPEDPAA